MIVSFVVDPLVDIEVGDIANYCHYSRNVVASFDWAEYYKSAAYFASVVSAYYATGSLKQAYYNQT